MARIFKTPFGAQGDTEQVPEAPQGDGSVSLTQGFGYDYEREYEDPAAKDIRREVMNGLFHDVTEAIGDIQLSGVAKWDADAAPYPAGAVVWHSSGAWMSTAGNNNSVPGTGSWKAVDLSSSIRLSEPIDQVPSANNVQEALAGLGVLGTNFATADEAQALESLTKLISPGRLDDAFKGGNQSLSQNGYQILPGGLIIQWGRWSSFSVPSGGYSSGDRDFNFPFPTNVHSVLITSRGDGVVLSLAGEGRRPVGETVRATALRSETESTGVIEWLAIGH